MKKHYIFLFAMLCPLLLWAQVTTSPMFITQTGGSFDIIYDASAGSAGLQGLTTGVYAHIGVITDKSTSTSDWKYVLTPWPDGSNSATANITKNTLTYQGNNIWKLSITPTIQSFLGVPSTDVIKKIALVFRNADGTKTGKTSSGGDILVDVYQAGLNVAFVNPAANGTTTAGTTLPIKIASSVNAALSIKVNGTTIKSSTTDSTTLTTTYNFSSVNDYTLIASATVSGSTIYDTAYICVPAAVTTATRPAGLKDGINYIDNNTATLIMYAPGKSNVFVIGDFNNWTQLNSYQMKKDGNYWWITLSGLTAGKLYGFQYLVDGSLKVSDPYTELVLDPWNDQWINQYYSIYPNMPAYPANKTEGLVATLQTAKPSYNWSVSSFTMPSKDNMIIYEMLLRDFTVEKSLDAAIAKLDYVKSLGVTAVELMPVQEFDGNNSWGYNPSHYFAPDKAYGTPDTYKKFIDECHKRGLAVILDMVFNQASGLCPFAALYWDSTYSRPAANNPWMNVTAPHMYSVLNDFNHSSTYTKEYFKRVLQYWITEYKVDGYRMDLTKGFTQNSGTESAYDQSRIDNLTEYYNAAKSAKSDVMFILEHFCVSDEENVLAGKGMYMWRNVNNAYSQSAMGYQSSSDFSAMYTSPRQWVGYAESHDEYRNFYKAKMYGAGAIATDSVARIGRVPLNIAFNVLIPGPKMLWQFGEMGYDYNSKYSDGSNDTGMRPSAWGYLNLSHRKAAADACAKVLNLRKQYPNAFTNGTFSVQITTNDWNAGKRIALTHADLNMVALGNFNASANITAYPNFPKTGNWYNLLTGETLNVTNTSMSVSMTPGQLLVYTDRVITESPKITYDAECEVYPTIATDKVTISTSATVSSVKVYNLQGTLIKNVTNEAEISVAGFISGMYLMEVITTNGKSIHKIIRQ